MKNKILSLFAVFTIFVLTSCAKSVDEKINLYGVQNPQGTNASSEAYAVFAGLSFVVAIALYLFYKKVTNK